MKRKWLYGLWVILIIIIAGISNFSSVNEKEMPEQNVVLTVLAGQDATEAGLEDRIDQVVTEAYPHVTLEWETVDWGEKFDSRLRADFAASEVPDIIIGKAQDVKTYYQTGRLARLDPALAECIDQRVLSDVKVGSAIYGLPYNEEYQGVLYNKGLFKRLGLKVPEDKAQLEHIVQVCKAHHVTPFAYSYEDITKVARDTMQLMINEVFRQNASWGDQFRLGIQFIDQSEEVKDCIEDNLYMRNNSWEDVDETAAYECDMRFAQGKAAMYLTNTASLSNILQYSEGRSFGIFPYPNTAGNAKLIRESNMTLMKSTDTSYSGLVDGIFQVILEDQEFGKETAEFTQTLPLIKGIDVTYPESLMEDIEFYKRKHQTINALTGYSQLNWNYLREIADKQIQWLDGKTTLDAVLYYAELKRADSAN